MAGKKQSALRMQEEQAMMRTSAPAEASWWPLSTILLTRITSVKVLIIGPSQAVADSVATYIRVRWPDAVVLSAVEGTDGIGLVDSEKPDVVVLDLDLPGVDGLDLLRQIRSLSQVPIMALSRRDDNARRIEALECGADDSISKPVSGVHFLARVSALFRRIAICDFKGGRLPSFAGNELWIDWATGQVSIGGQPVERATQPV